MTSVDFALIGHQERWEGMAAAMSALRGPGRAPVPLADLREIWPWIPPRTVCRIGVRSLRGNTAHGVGIESFIAPDRLEPGHARDNLARVQAATDCAVREGARVAALGGFSSILLEGRVERLAQDRGTLFTTGNTLTAAYIVHGVERAMALAGRDLGEASLLVIGASGDIGSACARCLAPRVKRLLLCARNGDGLHRLAAALSGAGAAVAADTELPRLVGQADLVICVASLATPSLALAGLRAGAIVCDAGYPRNVRLGGGPRQPVVFHGGMGQVLGGLEVTPDLYHIANPHPFGNVVHGCLLEGMALALEGRFESFSQGRGRITPQRVDEIWAIAQKHGFPLAPLFDGGGPVEDRLRALSPLEICK